MSEWDEFDKLTPEQRKDVLTRAKDAHDLNIAWSRHFDFKINSVQTAAGAVSAGMLAILGNAQTQHFTSTRIVALILLIPLILTLLSTLNVVNPWVQPTRKPASDPTSDSTGITQPAGRPDSFLFFADIASRYETNVKNKDWETYRQEAVTAYMDEKKMLTDLIDQTYSNADRCADKVEQLNRAVFFFLTTVIGLIGLGIVYLIEVTKP